MRDITPFSGGPPAEEHVDGKDPQDLFLGDQWKSEIREQTMLTEKLDDRDSATIALADLERVYPDISVKKVREEYSYWQRKPDFIDRAVAALRKAGLQE